MTENIITLTADDKTAKALVDTIKAAVNGAGKYAAYVTDHKVDRDNIKDHARALAVLAYPNDEPVQKKDGQRTRFGNAVQAAGNGLRAALGKDESEKNTDWMRLVKQAAENAANKGGFSAEQILAAVADTLGSVEDEQAA